MISDTDPKTQALWIELIRQMTPGQRMQRALEITEIVRSLFRANLRRENPDMTEAELTQRMIQLHYLSPQARAYAAK
jgi:hypothetical protein